MKKKLIEILQTLGLMSKVQKDGKLSQEEWDKVAEAYKEKFGVDLSEDVTNSKNEPKLAKEHQDAIAALFSNSDEGDGNQDDPPAEDPPANQNNAAQENPEDVNLAAEITKMKKEMSDLKTKNQKLEAKPEDGKGTRVKAEDKPKTVIITGRGHSASHIFGIDSKFFAREKWWNELAVNKDAKKSRSSRQISAFKEEFDTYGESLAARVEYLQENGLLEQLNNEKLAGSIDYTGFDSAWSNDEYVVRRQDALIAFIRQLPSVSSIFPVQYGVQDKMLMTNSFFTNFSRSYVAGKVFKGAYKLIPELAEVDDVMLKHKFSDLKDLEREYVGYLNREGSDPMKWTFIEWLMAKTLEVAKNEWNDRRILGYRIDPDSSNNPTHHRFASDGIIRRLYSYEESFQLLPYTDYSKYTSSTILTFIETFVEAVNQLLPSLKGYKLYMNSKHIPWLKAAYRNKYGTHMDFTGAELKTMDYELDGIVGVPNMGKSQLMWITMPGNLELYEDKAGEMEKIYFERELEELMACAWWKEGTGAYMVGRKYASYALLAAAGRGDQYIFMTDPFEELDDDATTCDGSKDYRFKTVANTTASKKITDITSAEEGIVYRIEIGSATQPQAIDKANKFSTIESNWVPTAVGDFIEVYYDSSESKFYEVRRQVTA